MSRKCEICNKDFDRMRGGEKFYLNGKAVIVHSDCIAGMGAMSARHASVGGAMMKAHDVNAMRWSSYVDDGWQERYGGHRPEV